MDDSSTLFGFFRMCSHDFQANFNDSKILQVNPKCFRIVPERARSFSECFGTVQICENREKSNVSFNAHENMCVRTLAYVCACVRMRM